ncbi:hypothetical protein SDC9_47218 [bioreactor metagenome]|uniref:Flavodoxin-like domain-containing protein n=1 Tax=bioreactor metagenome TaxID=1076179 RepID=A0A644WBY1_9ZZZZ
MSHKSLIAYFTHSGNTRKIAGCIHNEMGGAIFDIEPETPYPNSYNAVVAQAKKEIQAGHKPALKANTDDIDPYDIIFIGSPNWWHTMAPPVATFLSSHDWSGKTVVPFCTHGGGGQENVLRDIARLCPQAAILGGFEVYGGGSGDTQAKISAWLRRIGVAE